MTYELFIGDYAYSSWSLRGWLLFRHLGLKPKLTWIDFNAEGVAEQLKDLAPARTVPVMRTADGTVIWDSLAMAEELHERHPDGNLWPEDPAARALGRSLAAEMHSGFGALRSECPMNLRKAYSAPSLSDETLRDIARIDEIWTYARTLYADHGPWLLGQYSIADMFYAPVAARFAGYDAKLSDTAQSYVDQHLSDIYFRQWRTMALVSGDTLPWYAKAFETRPWPGPKPRKASAIETGPSINASCPFTGREVQHFLSFEGRIYGFENAVCRDETVQDPEAWPAFMELVKSTG